MLLELARDSIKKSYERRFESPSRSLELARTGLKAAQALAGTSYLSSELQADLEAEALMYLANAKRINSQIVEAGRALKDAARRLDEGTGDRFLKADRLQLEGHLRFSEGSIDQAIELFEREIKLRRALKDREGLGNALINRGVAGTWSDPIIDVCGYFEEGVRLVSDSDCLLVPLIPLAERLARDGQGLQAWKVVCSAETALTIAGSALHRMRLRWAKGLAYRTLGETRSATRQLVVVREHFLEEDRPFLTALVSLDLAATYAAQGRAQEVKDLAEEAYTIFRAEGLETRALTAFLMFRDAALAERLTEELAVRVANFIARHQYDSQLRFEAPEET